MPRCPQCQEISARRKNEACPKCYIPVKLYDGEWFLFGATAPNIELLKYWEALLSDRIGEQFSLPRKSTRYFREAKFAQVLINWVVGDLEVAKQALWLAFNDKGWSWKTITSLISLEKDWPALTIMARPIIRDQRQREKAAKERYADLMDLESD
jgi:hypothetical protein